MSTTTANRGPSPASSSPFDKEESAAYLRSLLNKNLRVTTTDNRMFWGAFKCTDSVSQNHTTASPATTNHHYHHYHHVGLTNKYHTRKATSSSNTPTNTDTPHPSKSPPPQPPQQQQQQQHHHHHQPHPHPQQQQ